jgi:hypothetical protein
MATVLEMAEAHLLNVQREITSLKERGVALTAEIERLQNYLEEGIRVLTDAKMPPPSQQEVKEVMSLDSGSSVKQEPATFYKPLQF